MGAEQLRELLAARRDFGDDDLGGAAGAQGLDDGETDGPAAEDEDGVVGLEGRDVHGVPADGQGLDEGCVAWWSACSAAEQGRVQQAGGGAYRRSRGTRLLVACTGMTGV